MPIRDVIAVVNQMQSDGIVEAYAIGGAVGATFYLEPVVTLDVDVFVMFRGATNPSAHGGSRFAGTSCRSRHDHRFCR